MEELEYAIADCFVNQDDTCFIKVKQLLQECCIDKEYLERFAYMRNEQVMDRLKKVLEECYNELENTRWKSCSHPSFSEGEEEKHCTECGVSTSFLRDQCSHSWVPAGAKKNKDRVHNKANGRGKYRAYQM